jgi:hypothetical protein
MISRRKLDCGSCSWCCFLMAVPDINKPACLWCEHADRPHGGCQIYDKPEKPRACTDFMCLWRASQERLAITDRQTMEERPDRSGVMFYDALDEEQPNTIYAHVQPDRPGAWQEPLPKARIDLILSRGGSVHVIIGYRRIVLEPGKLPETREDDGAAARTALRRIA